jgi:hypothetical protein
MHKTILALAAVAAGGAAASIASERTAGEAGTVYGGAIVDQDWGRPLASGDLDGDGFDEVIVGASESFGGVVSEVYVIRGGPDAHQLGTIDLSLGGSDHVILGAMVDDNLGSSIATGDVNGDGVDDLLICASTADFSTLADRGIAYLIFGGPTFFNSATRDLSVAGSWDFRILGPVAGGDMGGANLFGGLDAHAAAIGRLNNDIYGDMILGVHLADGGAGESGRVYVVFGGPFVSGFTANLSGGAGNVRINGAGSLDELGTVVLAGDLTGDGLDELILPNEYASEGLFTSEGRVHIFRGRASWPTTINLNSTAADITLLGAREDDNLGSAAAVGDFNNDGVMDLVTAAPGADAGVLNDQRGDGFVYGLLGSAAYQTGAHTIDYLTATPDFQLIGEFEENLGVELSAGDFNADGIDDIAASERFAGPQTNGVVEVLYGRAFSAGATFTANVDTNLRIVGAAQDRIGFSLAAGNVNGDGRDEILFGTPFNNSNHGTAYVFTHTTSDYDDDGDIDADDAATFYGCMLGPDVAHADGDPCRAADDDADTDVDLHDLAALQIAFTGP